jgi:N-acetylglutamate synthase-like GNAT family acetyltransferase
MEIREIRESELAALLELYQHLHKTDAPLPSSETVQSVWREIVTSTHIKCFGVFEENALVSTCVLTIVPNLTRGCRSYGLIENVVTHPQYRKRGLGTALLRHTLKYAWQRECYKVMLLTGQKREEIYRFYESAGFDRYAKQAFQAKPDN